MRRFQGFGDNTCWNGKKWIRAASTLTSPCLRKQMFGTCFLLETVRQGVGRPIPRTSKPVKHKPQHYPLCRQGEHVLRTMHILLDSCSLVGPGILENVKSEMAPETPSPHCPSLQREPQSFWQDHSPALQLMRPDETHGEHHIHQKPHYPNQKQSSETV
jgi:hypothetical protein